MSQRATNLPAPKASIPLAEQAAHDDDRLTPIEVYFGVALITAAPTCVIGLVVLE